MLCETLASQSLKIQLIGSPSASESCLEIEDTLLALSQVHRGLKVYLDKGQKDRETLFRRLYQEGIVTESWEVWRWTVVKRWVSHRLVMFIVHRADISF